MTSGRISPPPSDDDRGPENTPSSVPHFSEHGRRREVAKPSTPTVNARHFVMSEYSESSENLLAYHRGKFRAWNGSWWAVLDESDLRSRIVRFFEHAYFIVKNDDGLEEVAFDPTPAKVNQIVDTLKSLTNKGTDRLMPSWPQPDHPAEPEEILPVANGLLYLPMRALISPTPVFFNAYALPYGYNPEAPTPERWIKFQDEVFGDDEEAKLLLQEWMGYLLTVDTSQQKIMLMVGPKRAGKSTIGRVITALLGANNVAGTSMNDLCDPHGLQELADKPAANIADARMPKGKETTTAVERLLSISGEDPQSVNPKFKNRYTVKLPTRITMMTNELPKLIDTSGVLVSRLLVLRFRESYFGREDPGLLNDLIDELPGILLWALDGRDRLNERGHFLQPESGQSLIEDLLAMASPISAFIDERCVVGPDEKVEIDPLYRNWSEWCKANGHIPGSKNGFLGKLRAVSQELEVTRGGGTPRKREYHGIGLA